MGLLEDAIREHLDLKRLHGAAEGEVEKLEGEAFGPATGSHPAAAPPQESAPAPLPPEPEPEPEAELEEPQREEALEAQPTSQETVEHDALSDERDSGAPEEELFAEPPPQSAPPPPPADPQHEAPPPAVLDDHAVLEQRLADETEAPPPVRRQAPPEDTDDFFVDEPDSEEQAAAEREALDAEADEILEETPEFLDSPEHDRLWFEQRPPKDFDFGD